MPTEHCRNARVLIAGISTRAAVESACRAGFDVTSIDAFADLDQPNSARALSLARDFGAPYSARNAARAASTIDCDAVVYLSNFENHPRSVATLTAGRALWGNTPDVLRRVRNPLRLSRTLESRGFKTPRVSLDAPGDPCGRDIEWLIKPRASGGGHGVRSWRPAGAVPRRCYLQQRIDGQAGSVVFVAARGRALVLGFSRLLVGDAVFGVSGYRYCGNILASAEDDSFLRHRTESLSALATAMAEEFGLVGVNAIDFVAHDGVPYVIEVNPRWSASMELIERSYGLSIFAAHASACMDGELPDFEPARTQQCRGVLGKAVVFARRDVVLGNPSGWLKDEDIRDVPRPGERIAAGHPICTVFATGETVEGCRETLRVRAAGIHAELDHFST